MAAIRKRGMLRFPAKDVVEVVDVAFPFAKLIAAGDAIVSAALDVEVWDSIGGATHATPEAIISGAPTLLGETVRQRIRGGVAGVVYLLACRATTASGVVRLCEGTLRVITAPG